MIICRTHAVYGLLLVMYKTFKFSVSLQCNADITLLIIIHVILLYANILYFQKYYLKSKSKMHTVQKFVDSWKVKKKQI